MLEIYWDSGALLYSGTALFEYNALFGYTALFGYVSPVLEFYLQKFLCTQSHLTSLASSDAD